MNKDYSKIELIERENVSKLRIDDTEIKSLKYYEIKRDIDIVEIELKISIPVENFITN